MDKESVYAKLQRLADPNSGATDSERESAIRAMNRLRERYGDGIVPEEEVAQGHIDLRYTNEYERILIGAVALHLDLGYYTLRRVRQLKEIRLKGDVGLLDVAQDLYNFHREKLEKVLDYVTRGYTHGSMPYEAKRVSAAEYDHEGAFYAELGAMMAKPQKTHRRLTG